MTVLSPTFIPVPGVTLDGAYDFGGAGVGRTITVDAGAVHLDNRQTTGEIQRIDVGAPIVLTAALSGLVIDIFTNVTTAGFQASAILMPWNGTAGFNTTITRSHLSLGAAPIISIVKEGAGLSLVMNGAGVDHLRLRLKRTDSFVTPNSVAFFVVEGTNLGGGGFEVAGTDYVATSLVAGAEDIEMRFRTRTAGVSSERLLIVPTGVQFKNTASVVTAVMLAAGRLILGGTAPVGAEFLRVVGDARVEGKLTVTGVIDPTQVLLSGADKKYGATDAGPVYLAPFADAITGVQVRKANSVTVILNVDTTNNRLGINNSAPAQALDVTGTVQVSAGVQAPAATALAITAHAASVWTTDAGLLTIRNSSSLANQNQLVIELTQAVDGFIVLQTPAAGAGVASGRIHLFGGDATGAGSVGGTIFIHGGAGTGGGTPGSVTLGDVTKGDRVSIDSTGSVTWRTLAGTLTISNTGSPINLTPGTQVRVTAGDIDIITGALILAGTTRIFNNGQMRPADNIIFTNTTDSRIEGPTGGHFTVRAATAAGGIGRDLILQADQGGAGVNKGGDVYVSPGRSTGGAAQGIVVFRDRNNVQTPDLVPRAAGEGRIGITGTHWAQFNAILHNFVSRATDPAGIVGVWQEYVFDDSVTRELRIVGPAGTVNTIATLVP